MRVSIATAAIIEDPPTYTGGEMNAVMISIQRVSNHLLK